MSDLFILLPAVVGALIATGLFLFGIVIIARRVELQARLVEFARSVGLIRADENPILVPSGYDWEQSGVMNPAALEAGGRVHLFYRAAGADGMSRIGYAGSKNGTTIDERLPYPVFALQSVADSRAFAENSGLMASGGTFAGVEDPRAVVIDDRAYLSFNAFSNWNSLRVGVSSISVEDLLAKRWKWTPPVYLSPEGQVQKSWVLFPEKIHGKFAVLHSLHSGSRDRVLVDYLDSLDASHIESPYNPKREDSAWDSTVRGVGPPPLKTKDGWLVFYHANDHHESHKYKLGALLLDLEDPSKVIARSVLPVLSPDAPYENEGKPGIVYACGAVVQGDTLRVYYGGGDQVVCVASTSLSKLLRGMRQGTALPPLYAPTRFVIA